MTDQLEASIARIFLNDEDIPVGAGFLVSEKYVLTCAHVVAQALGISSSSSDKPGGNIRLDFPRVESGKFFSAHVVHWCPEQTKSTFAQKEEDIAVLELEEKPPVTAQSVGVETTDDLRDHPFRAYGFPDEHNEGEWTYGVLKDKLANGMLQIEGVKETGYRVMRGFSGTPVWDEQLKGVVGMVVASDKRASTKVAQMIPITQLIKVWPQLGPSPYRGLSAFQEHDAPFFFGREAAVGQLVEAVRRMPLVAVIGSSGSGKSSVVFAGLVPQIRLQRGWLIASFHPGDDPFWSLAAALEPLLDPQMSETDRLNAIDKLAGLLQQKDIVLHDVVERILQKHSSTHLIIIADQFEELYSLCLEVDQRQQFQDRLLSAAQVASHPLTPAFNIVVVFTLRADFFEHALAYRPFADALQNADLKLGPMTYQELQDAIKKPAQKLNVKIEDGLTERILDAVIQEPGNLPLLEFTLTLLWEKQREGKLTHADYDEIGGVEQALVAYAEKVYAGLSEEEKKRAQQIFIKLVLPGEGTADIRRRASRDDLGEEKWDLVVRLATAHLVVTGRDEATGKETVEVVHEALIRRWERLRKWIDSDRKFLTWREELRRRLPRWENSGRNNDELLRGVILAESQDWITQRPVDISPIIKEFIQASQQSVTEAIINESPIVSEALTIKFRIGKLNDYLLWFLLVLEVILLIQFFLSLIGAAQNNLFVGFLYALSVIPLFPFNSIVPSTKLGTGGAAIEWSTLIAMAVYFLLFYALRRFLRILISSPEEPVE